MRSLILHANATAQWHALVGEAQQECAIRLQENLESYLVFLLMRFSHDPSIAASILGLEFLQSYDIQLNSSRKHLALKEVGDKCLLYAGLFPARAQRKRVKISYFVKLGQSAYSTLSSYIPHEEPLFLQLCSEFIPMMDVLRAMRKNVDALDLLKAIELWQETGSLYAKRQVKQLSDSVIVFDKSDRKKH